MITAAITRRAPLWFLAVASSLAPLLAVEPLPPMESVTLLRPVTLPAPTTDFAPLPLQAAPFAYADWHGVRYAVRSGRRVTGTRPAFPGAVLLIGRMEGDRWRDLAGVDEAPESDLGRVDLKVRETGLHLTYQVRGPEGRVVARAVTFDPSAAPAAPEGRWSRLPDFPQAPGVAGLLAGVHQGVLLAAGGANFPDRMPWEGGVKQYYDRIYALRPGDTAWIEAGRLPEPRAYSAVVSVPEGLLVLGGENGPTLLSDSLLLQWTGTTVAIRPGPALPAPITSAVAVVSDGRVYLAGGYAPGDYRVSRKEFWSLDLKALDAGWRPLPTWPGAPRAMAILAAWNHSIYLLSGLDISPGPDGKAQTTYLVDAYRYDPDGTWTRLPDLPWSAIAAPSPAPVDPATGRIFVLGGVDGRQVGKMPREGRVPEDILVFDARAGTWRLWPQPWPHSVVTTPTFAQGHRWHFISGEIKAGVRTTAAWTWEIGSAP
jgi:N-acetylneuraminate epimerase